MQFSWLGVYHMSPADFGVVRWPWVVNDHLPIPERKTQVSAHTLNMNCIFFCPPKSLKDCFAAPLPPPPSAIPSTQIMKLPWVKLIKLLTEIEIEYQMHSAKLCSCDWIKEKTKKNSPLAHIKYPSANCTCSFVHRFMLYSDYPAIIIYTAKL